MAALAHAPRLRLADPRTVVGLPVVDRHGAALGTVAGVGANGRRVDFLLVRGGDGSTARIEQDRVLGFDAGRVLVR